MKLQILFISLLHIISTNYSLCQILTNKKIEKTVFPVFLKSTRISKRRLDFLAHSNTGFLPPDARADAELFGAIKGVPWAPVPGAAGDDVPAMIRVEAGPVVESAALPVPPAGREEPEQRQRMMKTMMAMESLTKLKSEKGPTQKTRIHYLLNHLNLHCPFSACRSVPGT